MGTDQGVDLATVRALEERAFNAWPSLQTVLADGWVMRFAAGYTKRANSVNAWAPGCDIAAILAVAAPLYARAGLPLIVRLTPLTGPTADAELGAKGFCAIDETLVMTAPLSGPSATDPDVVIAARPDAAWSSGFAAANAVPAPHRATHDAMLAAIRWPAAFARLERDARTIAWGLGVAERGMIGLFDIVTAREARRAGAARQLVGGLLAWGRTQQATTAYLQVVATNAPAIALYRRFGFTEAYRYHYRIAP